MNGDNAANAEIRALRMKAEYLHECCADAIEEFLFLEETKGRNIKNRYDAVVGNDETHLERLDIECRRWKRRFELRQKAINAGETPDELAIERILDEEFAQYEALLAVQKKECEQSVLELMRDRMPEEKANDIRVAFLKAVKKLHPDLNPNLPERARELWLRLLEARKIEDWREVRFLVSLADEAVGERKLPEDVPGLNAEIARLEAERESLRVAREELLKKKPFCYETFLADKEAVAARQKELADDIAALEHKLAEYEAAWAERRAA